MAKSFKLGAQVLMVVLCSVNLTSAAISKPGESTEARLDSAATTFPGGDYSFIYREKNDVVTSKLRLSVRDGRVVGDGVDTQGPDPNPFVVRGVVLKPDRIMFSKICSQKNQSLSARDHLYFSGKYESVGKEASVTGTWKSERVQGFSLAAQKPSIEGTWTAKLTRPHTYVFVN